MLQVTPCSGSQPMEALAQRQLAAIERDRSTAPTSQTRAATATPATRGLRHRLAPGVLEAWPAARGCRLREDARACLRHGLLHAATRRCAGVLEAWPAARGYARMMRGMLEARPAARGHGSYARHAGFGCFAPKAMYLLRKCSNCLMVSVEGSIGRLNAGNRTARPRPRAEFIQ